MSRCSGILSYDGLVFTLINRYPDGSFFQNGSQPWGEPVPGLSQYDHRQQRHRDRANTQLLLSAGKAVHQGVGLEHERGLHPYRCQAQSQAATTLSRSTSRRSTDYPFIGSDAVPKHRLVVAGSIDGPWGITFGAKVVLETPRPLNEVAAAGGYRPPDGSTCAAVGALSRQAPAASSSAATSGVTAPSISRRQRSSSLVTTSR